MRKIICTIFVFLLTLLLCACQVSPEKDVVSSRNDGSFDTKAVESAQDSHTPDETESLSYLDTFLSTDGSVTFQIDVKNSISTPNMPVVEVVPHAITEAEARNAALALCGSSSVFYEAEPSLNEKYSKSDIISQIDRWLPYTSVDGMKQLFPNRNETTWQSDAQTLRETITYLSGRYLDNNAPDYEHTPCEWTFHKSSHYIYGADEAAKLDTSRDNDEISAWVSNGAGRYGTFTVSCRDNKDFKLNNIFYSATISGPLLVDYALLRAEKLRTERPTDTQIEAAIGKAQAIMDQMGLGMWNVDFSDIGIHSTGEITEYTINLSAVPVFQGVPAIHRPQLSNLKSQEAYASNYYLTEATFEYSADGTLMDFILYSPVDIKQVVNENTKTIAMDEIINRAKEHLSLSDAYEYGASLDYMDEDYSCTVTITHVEYGLTRTKVPNTDESYYYVPAAMLSGNVEYKILDTDEVFFCRDNVQLLIVNAVDGSIIPLDNE